LSPTIAGVFDLQLYIMNVPTLLYIIGGGSAEAVPPTAKARPTAAAMAATIRAILIPTPEIRRTQREYGSANDTCYCDPGLKVEFLISHKKDRTKPK
jgi:hypothetical protein